MTSPTGRIGRDASMNGDGSERAGPFWRGRSVFVTGGAGLIGSWVVKRLLGHGARVVLLIKETHPAAELLRSGDISRCAVVYGELEDYDVIEHAIGVHEAETVIHLAAQTLVGVAHRNPLGTFESNVRGTYNLLEACRTQRQVVRRIVVASSDKAYGDKDTLPYTEEMSLDARNSYDVSKSCCDLISQAYARTYGLPVAITRFGNVYGGGDLNLSRIVPGTIRSFHFGERPVLRSDGTYTRDYLYVEDVADGYLRLAEALDDDQLHGEAFNFSTQSRISVLELVARIASMMGCAGIQPDIQNTAEAEIRHQHLDAAKALRLLGWQARYDLEQGLASTIDWYRKLFSEGRA